MVLISQTLTEMVWPQPQNLIQCEYYTAIGVDNDTIIHRKPSQWTYNFTGSVSGNLKTNSVTSGHLAPQILATTAPIIIRLSITHPTGPLILNK